VSDVSRDELVTTAAYGGGAVAPISYSGPYKGVAEPTRSPNSGGIQERLASEFLSKHHQASDDVQFGDTAGGAAAFAESFAQGLDSCPEILSPLFAAARKIADGTSLADICCALGSIKRASDQIYDLVTDKRQITIAGVLARAAYFEKVLPQLEKALLREQQGAAKSGGAAAPRDASTAEKIAKIQAMLRHVEQMEQCMIHEASALRAQVQPYPPESRTSILANATALSQLNIFLPLSLTSNELMNTIERLDQAPVEKYVDGASTRDFVLRDAQPSLLQRLTDIRLLSWSSVAAGSVLLNTAVPYELVVGLCGVGSLLIGGAVIKNRADRESNSQTELAASVAAHEQARDLVVGRQAECSFQKLARVVSLDEDIFTQYERDYGEAAARARFADAVVRLDGAPEYQNPRGLTDICGLFEQARDLSYWVIEMQAGTASLRPAAYTKIVEAVANRPAHYIGQMLDCLIGDLVELSVSVKRAEAFHLKTTLQRFRPMIGFTHGRQQVMRVYDAALNRINRLLASDLDRAKYQSAEDVDEAAVAQWSDQDITEMQNALAEGRVRLNNAVLPTARDNVKIELSNHIYAALRHRGSGYQRSTVSKLIGRIVTASGSSFDEAVHSDLIERLAQRQGFEPAQLIAQSKMRVQWTIRGGRFIVSCRQAYQWNNPQSGEGAETFDCLREVLFDIHSGRFEGEFYHVS
jgi:uncharacterized protein (DUF4415 family)